MIRGADCLCLLLVQNVCFIMFVSSCLFHHVCFIMLFHYVCADYCSFRLLMLIIVVFVIVALKNEKKWLKK